jgi:hypothetical protein
VLYQYFYEEDKNNYQIVSAGNKRNKDLCSCNFLCGSLAIKWIVKWRVVYNINTVESKNSVIPMFLKNKPKLLQLGFS